MGSQAYTSTKPDTHGAPRDSPLGPLSAGGAPPARGPPSIGGIRPIIATPTTVAWWIKVCHSADTPTHCSRTLSYYMWAHIPSGTSCRTSSNHRRRSSIPPLDSSCGSRVGLAPTSSRLCLCLTRSSSHSDRTGPWRADSSTISASWTHICKHKH
jgi:hypothetical protein